MKWKPATANFQIVVILTICYTVVTMLNIIGPLHTDAAGEINQSWGLAILSILYWSIATFMTWAAYFFLQERPKVLFFTLMILGITVIVTQNFLWAWWGL